MGFWNREVLKRLIPEPDSVYVCLDSEGKLTICDGAVDTAKLKDSAVTSAKIMDGAVTTAKLANGAITAIKIAEELRRILVVTDIATFPSTSSNGDTISNPANATDSNSSTYASWSPPAGVGGDNIVQVDLGVCAEAILMYKIEISTGTTYDDFYIEISEDGSTWTRLYSVALSTYKTYNISGVWVGKARYARINVYGLVGGGNASIKIYDFRLGKLKLLQV